MTSRWHWAVLLAALIAACSPSPKNDTPVAQASPTPAEEADTTSIQTSDKPSGMEHGDHIPRFGGLVLMEGNLHFEVLAGHAGKYQIYFSDELRAPEPASVVSAATITVMRPNAEPEAIDLKVDEASQSWIGQGRPVEDPATTIRISYTRRGRDKPNWIDVPLVAWELALGAK